MAKKMLAISGLKNSGKTSLIEMLLPLLNAEGIKTAVIKHDGHSFEPDTPGTDSYRFFTAGACASVIFDAEKYCISRRGAFNVTKLAEMMPEADLVILEGFKNTDIPKIELVRSDVYPFPICDPATCIAYVSDMPLAVNKPVFHPEAIYEILLYILDYLNQVQVEGYWNYAY